MKDSLSQNITRLIGKECWSSTAGAGTGSQLLLRFGRKIPRDVPLTNPQLGPEARKNDAEYALFVKCVWRLDNEDGVVCGAWDDNRTDGLMLRGLAFLTGQKVSAVLVEQPGLDLKIEFENGVCLKIFCDQINEQDGDDNYTLFLPEKVMSVCTRSVLVVEPQVLC